MEGNNFEKKVRKVLEGMEITPSDHLWTNVQQRIRKKKDRRLVPVLFVLLGLCLATGGYWVWNSMNGNEGGSVASENGNVVVKKPTAQDFVRNITEGQPVAKGVGKDAPEKVNEKIASSGNQKKSSVVKQQIEGIVEIVQQDKTESKGMKDEPKVKSARIAAIVNHSENVIAIDSNKIQTTGITKRISEFNADEISINSFFREKIQRGSLEIVPVNDLTLLHSPIASPWKNSAGNNSKKWMVGFTFSAGLSQIGNSFLEAEKRMDPPTMNFPGGSVNNGSPGFPSMPKHSVAFVGGVVAKKEISSSARISVGVNYKYYSTTNVVGYRIGATTDYYYSRNQFGSSTYHNSFHFIEIPLGLDVRLTKPIKLPLYWNGNIYVSELLTTNALQSGTNGYISDNGQFNKTYVGFGSGIFITLFSKQNLSLNIGPYIKYDLSKIADKGLYNDDHFTFLGIRSEILFSGKK